MLARVTLVACLVAGAWAAASHLNQDTAKSGGAGDPLFLTPYIEKGQFDLAKSLARVGNLKGYNVPSYSGYLTVNKTTQSNLFFWFVPALKNAETAPIILWLQGGPGSTSLMGLFVESGPYIIDAQGKANPRKTAWTQQFNIIYIDNPVGTGFSFTKSDDGYATNQADVGRDLFEALQQFFTLFNEYANSDFYAAGESYAGKYVPSIAYTIHKNKDKAKMKLKGVSIGDGVCDPPTMLNYADFLEQIGLADQNQASYIRSQQDKTLKFIKQGDFVSAYNVFNELVLGNSLNGSQWRSYMDRITGFGAHYNYVDPTSPQEIVYFSKFVQTNQSRRAIHVGNNAFHNGLTVKKRLVGDWMVLLYTGQLDVLIPAPMTLNFINSIPWDGANALFGVERIIWRNKKTHEPAGYVRQVQNFTEILVRNAGHLLIYDQPENAYDMIDRFINDKPFN